MSSSKWHGFQSGLASGLTIVIIVGAFEYSRDRSLGHRQEEAIGYTLMTYLCMAYNAAKNPSESASKSEPGESAAFRYSLMLDEVGSFLDYRATKVPYDRLRRITFSLSFIGEQVGAEIRPEDTFEVVSAKLQYFVGTFADMKLRGFTLASIEDCAT